MMLIWDEYRWVIYLAIVVALIILLDEWAYYAWKKMNPGAMYSHLYDKTLTPLDPSRPPTTRYE